jgi:hypothetical protein
MNSHGNRIHWGVGLGVGFVVFVIGILVLVIISMSREVDLVTDQYYEKELQYQQRIDALQRGSDPRNAVVVTEGSARVVVQFPRHRQAGRYAGSIVLYRPANVHDDLNITVDLDSACQQVIPTARLARGLWRLKMDWIADSDTCFAEKVIILQ